MYMTILSTILAQAGCCVKRSCELDEEDGNETDCEGKEVIGDSAPSEAFAAESRPDDSKSKTK